MFSAVPKPNTKLLNPDGSVTNWWYQFFSAIFANPVPESAVTVTASPFSYTAQVAGAVTVTGGTVSLIQIKRSLTNATGLTTGVFPVGKGDILIVTYTVVPTMVFLPS